MVQYFLSLSLPLLMYLPRAFGIRSRTYQLMKEMEVCADLAMKSSVRYWPNCVISIQVRVYPVICRC